MTDLRTSRHPVLYLLALGYFALFVSAVSVIIAFAYYVAGQRVWEIGAVSFGLISVALAYNGASVLRKATRVRRMLDEVAEHVR